MLKYKINNQTIKNEIIEVNINNIESLIDGFMLTTTDINSLKDGDNISIFRNNGRLSYKDVLSITDVNVIDNTFKINKFPLINYGIDSIFSVDNNRLYIQLGNEHFFVRNEQFNVKRKITSYNPNMEGLEDGDYVIVDEYYLNQIHDVNGSLTLTPAFITNKSFNVDYLSVKYTLDIIVPMTNDGFDNKFGIILETTNNNPPVEVIELIENSFNSILLYSDDTRFIENNALTNGTHLTLNRNYFNINIGAKQGAKSNLFQTENIEKDFVEKGVNENINPIIDMEKYVFKPFILTDNINKILTPLSTIEFNFHFRDREGSDKWQTNNDKYWNGFMLNNNGNIVPKTFADGTQIKIYGDEQSDLLGYLNFSDEDVRYQKSKLKKSFMRILYYDSPDMNTQQLLYYSTVFFNTNQLFGKFGENHLNPNNSYQNIKDGNLSDDISVNNEYILDDIVNEKKRFSTRMTLTDKYNANNSSEGFYLYLFSETFKKPYEEDIYMKVEFNHAGYGLTIPFIMPTNENGVPIPFIIGDEGDKMINPDFPSSFIEIDDNGSISSNMDRYFDSLYVKIKLKCDYENNIFAYYIDGLNANESDKTKLTLNFIEPKVQ